MKRFVYILFLLFSFSQFFLSNNPVFALKKKKVNENVIKAQELIKKRFYNDALKILIEEIDKDEDNEDLIMKLIDDIEREKEKVIGMIYTVKESIKQGNFELAEEILEELGETGEFDTAIKKIVELMMVEKEPLEEINDFNNYIREAEKGILVFNLTNALKNYKSALDIFRVREGRLRDQAFDRALQRFNAAELKIRSAGIDKRTMSSTSNINYNYIVRERDRITRKVSDWKRLESEFLTIRNMFEQSGTRAKKNIAYEAYHSIVDKYISYIRRGIQREFIVVLERCMRLAGEELEKSQKDIRVLKEFDRVYSLLGRLEEGAFYNLSIYFRDRILIARSKKNLVYYLDYSTRKNGLIVKKHEIIALNEYNDAAKLYGDFLKLNEQKNKLRAELTLKKSEGVLGNYTEKINDLKSILTPYNDFNYKDYNEYRTYLGELNNKKTDLNKQIETSKEELDDSIRLIKSLLAEADSLFDNSLGHFNSKSYKKAKSFFVRAKDKYLEVAMLLKSEDLDKKIDEVEDYIQQVDRIIFEIEIAEAEKYIETAKGKFYAEDFEGAKLNIDNADAIYKKYKQNRDIIEYYNDRIQTALRIQSGSKLSVDDQAYSVIVEMFKNARRFYDRGNYEKARDYITQILLEKPYYKEARLFEVKILLETDPESFEKIYKNYYAKAKAKYDNQKYDEALIEFQQLLQFKRDAAIINNYIYNCKVRLNLVKKTLSRQDKQAAISLVKEAQASYASGKYSESLDKANRAIKIWEDVPDAGNVILASRQKLGFKKPSLTRENELRFKEAQNAYKDGNYEKVYQLTREILRTQDFEEVRKLNRKADLKRKG